MLFIVEIPDRTFRETMTNRQTVAKRMREVLRASSPSANEHPYSVEVPWEEFVFHSAKVEALPTDLMDAIRKVKESV